MRAIFRGFAVGVPIFILLSVALLYGLSFLTWRGSAPSDALDELTLPPQAEVVARFGPTSQLPVPVGGAGEVLNAEGLILRTDARDSVILGDYVDQFEALRWVVDDTQRGRAETTNRIQVLVEPINAETVATLTGETLTLSEGERLWIVLAWKTGFWG